MLRGTISSSGVKHVLACVETERENSPAKKGKKIVK